MRAVFDANVVASGICWNGEPYLCLIKIARRQVFAFGTTETLEETREVTAELISRRKPKHNATARLTWYLEHLNLVDPAPLGKQRSRDPKDDPDLAAAMGAEAQYIVTFDRDLLSLKKPFGIEIISPSQLLKAVRG
jgi:uncharacterized protein